jgi:PAS domain S-box-containing protein
MKNHRKKLTSFTDSMVVTGICLAAFYWVCESCMYFFLEPEANIIQHLIGPDLFEVWTRLLVLCLLAIFGSHFQYTMNKRRLADEALRDSEEKYRTILESIEEGYFEIDLDHNLTFFSDPFCKILGYSRAELLGANMQSFATPQTTEKMIRVYDQVERSGQAVSVTDYDIVRKDGRKAALELSTSLIRHTEGYATGFRGVLRDVSERKLAEEEKRRLEMQLRAAQKMESIGTLAGGIAHDFNSIRMGI